MRTSREPRSFIEGFLELKHSGRWAIDGVEISSGEVFEVKLSGQWVRVRMEHDGQDYFTVPQIGLFVGMEARQ